MGFQMTVPELRPAFDSGFCPELPASDATGIRFFQPFATGETPIPFPEEILFFGFGKGDFECLVPAGVHDPFRRLRIGIDKGVLLHFV